MRRFYKGNRGSFTIEATVAVPVFLLLLVFLINFISVAAVYVAMDHAVSETAKIIASSSFPLHDLKLTVNNLPINSSLSTGKQVSNEPVSVASLIPGIGTQIINDVLQKASGEAVGIVLDSAGKEIVTKLIKEFYPLKKLDDGDFRLVEVRLLTKKKKEEPGLRQIDLKPEDITIVVVYKVKMPVPFVHLREFTLSNIAVERAWTDG